MKQPRITHSCVQETVPRRPPADFIDAEFACGMVIDDRYELIAPLGKGGMSEVYEALHITLREPRAVKLMSKSTGDDVAVERFNREARTTVRLKHPNIVEVADAGVSKEGHRFIVMELLRGETLSELMSRIPLEDRDEDYLRDILMLILEACEGVSAAHAEGVLHRDLKPSNIFLHRDTPDGDITPKILDFGIARDLELNDSKLTATGQITGSIDYVSPEQIEEQEPDFRSDVYSLGVILYEALTGATPLGKETRAMKIVRAVDPGFRIVPPSKHNPKVPRYLDRITLRALRRNPDERYATVDELIEVLRPLPLLQTVQSETSGDIYRPGKSKGRGAKLIWGSAAAVLLTGAAVLGIRELSWLDRGKHRDEGRPLPEARADVSPVSALKPPESGKTKEQTHRAESTQSPAVKKEPQKRRVGKAASRPKPAAPSRAKAEKEDVEALVAEGYRELANMNFQTACMLFEKAINVDPRSARSWFGLSKVAFEKRDFGAALDKVNRALGYLDRARWRVFRGEIHLAKGDKAAAAREWQRVISDFPDDKVADRVARRHLQQIGVRLEE